MFVRGSNNANEYRRDDNSFYKGIVVKNWDPAKLYRVKVYIPELSNQPLEEWLKKYKSLNFRFPGTNNEDDVWSDTKVFEEMAKYIPWAEPCFPILGENSPARYQSLEEISTLTDSNFEDTFETNNEEPPTVDEGAFGPSFWYENKDTNSSDAMSNPTGNFIGNNNPYSFLYRPANHVNKPKGVYAVPSVGSKVWVFMYKGDPNFPVYVGGRHDFRENVLITNSEASENLQSLDYPGTFENKSNFYEEFGFKKEDS